MWFIKYVISTFTCTLISLKWLLTHTSARFLFTFSLTVLIARISVKISKKTKLVSAQDVSADLRELGRTPVAVIAAGVKSILDIARTLEYLVGPIAKYLDFAQHCVCVCMRACTLLQVCVCACARRCVCVRVHAGVCVCVWVLFCWCKWVASWCMSVLLFAYVCMLTAFETLSLL